MQILVATDADHVVNDVTAALGGPDVSFTVCRNGRDVSPLVGRRSFDLAVLDLQSGSMGAMAVTMGLRLDESASDIARTKVLMLLDRQADVHLAKRCDADGWVIKPLNPLTLRRAAMTIVNGPPATEPPEMAEEDTAVTL